MKSILKRVFCLALTLSVLLSCLIPAGFAEQSEDHGSGASDGLTGDSAGAEDKAEVDTPDEEADNESQTDEFIDAEISFEEPALAAEDSDTAPDTVLAPLSISVSYDVSALACDKDITFTFTANGGSGSYKYRVGAVFTVVDGENYYESEFRNAQLTEDNTFTYRFMASGSYNFYAYVYDIGNNYSYARQYVTLTINDPSWPTVSEKADAIAADCRAKGFSTDYEKALYLHDWLIENADYDWNLQYAGAGGVLCRGTGTCESYHRAFTMLLKRVGISCERATGNGHVWTCVLLDGEWTQIDVTWDDGGSEELYHLYFGLTDELMATAHSEHSPSSARPCTSLERNWFIRSGAILNYSEPIRTKIDAELSKGSTSFEVQAENHLYPSVYKILYPIVCWYLQNKVYNAEDWEIKYELVEEGSGSTVSYKNSKYIVNKVDKCAIGKHYPAVLPAVACVNGKPGKTEGSYCSECGAILKAQETVYCKTAIVMAKSELPSGSVWIDGIEYSSSSFAVEGDKCYLDIGRTNAASLVSYTYNKSSSDVHQVYPTGMQVWLLSNDGVQYTAQRAKQLDNLLQYAGSSIRITGKKGIRMITGISEKTKTALTGSGLSGLTLQEYGTVISWASELPASKLVLGGKGVKSNYAYKKGVADPVFAVAGGNVQYTNVLVGFTDDQCIPDIVMRAYIVLKDSSGRSITLYGGPVQRSIGYIAYQNRAAFAPGTSSYKYVWDIIHHVYGNKYDSEYKA